jgi:hypothetical protein
MPRALLVATVGALALAASAAAVGPAATAAQNCKGKSNQREACTAKLRANAQRKSGSGVGDKDVQTLGAISTAIKSGSANKRIAPGR